jgi:diguanylate cyclase (GGDEF)-like protein
VETKTRSLWFYQWMSRFDFLSYRTKILLMAFVGTHIPLITLAVYFALQTAPDWQAFFTTVGITLLATLAGTGITLYVLNHLLRPVLLTSQALRDYRETRLRTDLPSGYTDEVGTLMSDAGRTMNHLDSLLDTLEHRDQTTGLPNRKRFLQVLQSRLAKSMPVGVLVLRIDNLARIAETFDHGHADEVSRVLAARFQLSTDLGSDLARIDATHFAAIVGARQDDTGKWIDAASRVKSAIDGCSEEVRLDAMSIVPVLRGGLAAFPDDGNDAVTLLDRALAAAAQAGDASPVTLHSAPARHAALQRFRVEQDLRRALDRNEFELYYQPVIDTGAGEPIGAEALIRWRHPERGLLAPGEFIAAAETSGLIEPIGLWVLRRACEQVREWNDKGHPNLRMAINLSARQFLDPNLMRHVVDAVEHHGISPAQLEIELTETAAMVDHDYTRRLFTSLRDMGVGIAIDDFGTGFASMSYLRTLPFDKLKIDREFVTNVHQLPQSQAICGALIELSRGLGLRVVAEGTESEEEVRYLVGRGCHLFQGYYFSRPVPGRDFAGLLGASSRFVLPEPARARPSGVARAAEATSRR